MPHALDRTWLDEGEEVMRNKRLRLVSFDTGGSDLQQWEVGWSRMFLSLGLGVVLIAALVAGAFALSHNVLEKRTLNTLSEENQFLRKQLKGLHGRLAGVDQQLRQLEKENETLQIVAGLPPEEREPAADGSNFFSAPPPPDVTRDLTQEASYMARLVDGLEHRIDFASETQSILEVQLVQNKKQILHTPSIRPVFGGRVTDKYGNRLDPFIGRLRHHDGIDIAAARGTEVYASASGVVELARQRYRTNEGYGRVVVINHGNDVKTLYGHLSKIFVRTGQRVSRWEVIGLSGETGRATGPHLHYEIWVHDRPQDPEEFILN